MKPLLTLILIALMSLTFAQDHTHEQKPSTVRQEWPEFEDGELIKTQIVDWTKTPIAGHVLKNGQPKEGFEYVDSIDVYSMVYVSDGLLVTGFMVRPKSKGKYPSVIFNRGGNRDHGQLLVATALTKMGVIAAQGYVVIASNYRGNSNSEGKEEFGGSDVNDVINLIPALGQIEVADTSRIGMVGVSRGGMMAYLALKEICNIKAVAVIGGLSDLFIMKAKRPELESHVYTSIIPHYDDSTETILNRRSANKWAGEMCKTPLLMLHGEKDKSCDVSMARELHDELKNVEYPHVYMEFAKGNHGLSKYEVMVTSLIIQWLDKYVKNGENYSETSDYSYIK